MTISSGDNIGKIEVKNNRPTILILLKLVEALIEDDNPKAETLWKSLANKPILK